MLPQLLKAALDERLEGVSRAELARRSHRISDLYRNGAGSAVAIRDELDVLAYATARMPATFASVTHALQRTCDHLASFAPSSLLDLGAGPGSSAVAALSQFSGITTTTLVEAHRVFRGFAAGLLKACGCDARILPRDLGRNGAALPSADLVLASYVLVEMPEADVPQIVTRAFTATNGLLLLVEPGTPVGFERVRLARDTLVALGGRVVAPCPGNVPCPMTCDDWCHFSVRVQRSREHKLLKQADVPFEDERYAYLAVTKDAAITGLAPATARVLQEPYAGRGAISLRLCTSSGLKDERIARRDRTRFKVASKLKWGDVYGE